MSKIEKIKKLLKELKIPFEDKGIVQHEEITIPFARFGELKQKILYDMEVEKMNKYRNIKVQQDDIKFDSKKELARYNELKYLVLAKVITNLELQKKFELIPKQKDERAVSYYADFVYQKGKETIVEDVKSEATKKDKAYIIKRKLLKYRYPNIIFKEV